MSKDCKEKICYRGNEAHFLRLRMTIMEEILIRRFVKFSLNYGIFFEKRTIYGIKSNIHRLQGSLSLTRRNRKKNGNYAEGKCEL